MSATEFFYADSQGRETGPVTLGDLLKASHLPSDFPLRYQEPGKPSENTNLGYVRKTYNKVSIPSLKGAPLVRSVKRKGGMALFSKPPGGLMLVPELRIKFFTLESVLKNLPKNYVDMYVMQDPIEECELCGVSFGSAPLSEIFRHLYSLKHKSKLQTAGVPIDDFKLWMALLDDVSRFGMRNDEAGCGLENEALFYDNRILPIFSAKSYVTLDEFEAVKNGIESLRKHFASLDATARNFLHIHLTKMGWTMKYCVNCNVHCGHPIQLIEHMLGDEHLKRLEGRISLQDIYAWNKTFARFSTVPPKTDQKSILDLCPPLLFHPFIQQSLIGLTPGRVPLTPDAVVAEINKLRMRLDANLPIFWDGALNIKCQYCMSNGIVVHFDDFTDALDHIVNSKEHQLFMSAFAAREDFAYWHEIVDRITGCEKERREVKKMLDPAESAGQLFDEESQTDLSTITSQIKSIFYNVDWPKVTSRFDELAKVLGGCKYCGLDSFENMSLILQHAVSDEHLKKMHGKCHGYSKATLQIIETMLEYQ